jgi:hypothetical protein
MAPADLCSTCEELPHPSCAPEVAAAVCGKAAGCPISRVLCEKWGFSARGPRLFDLAALPTQWVPRSFAFFAKGRESEMQADFDCVSDREGHGLSRADERSFERARLQAAPQRRPVKSTRL